MPQRIVGCWRFPACMPAAARLSYFVNGDALLFVEVNSREHSQKMPLLGKHLRIEKPVVTTSQRQRAWRMLANGEHVTVWEMSQADAVEELAGRSTKRQIFHIDFVEGVTKGCRAIFFGETYHILSVSDSSKRLRGLELQCVVT